jgi:hypothetical protein
MNITATDSTPPALKSSTEHALADRNAKAARDERLGGRPQVVHELLAITAPDLQHVAEALGGEHADDGALALEQGVDADRRAVQEVGGCLQRLLRDGVGDDVGDAFIGGGGIRRALADEHVAGLVVVIDEVGERATDVDSKACCH